MEMIATCITTSLSSQYSKHSNDSDFEDNEDDIFQEEIFPVTDTENEQ